jgi:hypothetical protein
MKKKRLLAIISCVGLLFLNGCFGAGISTQTYPVNQTILFDYELNKVSFVIEFSYEQVRNYMGQNFEQDYINATTEEERKAILREALSINQIKSNEGKVTIKTKNDDTTKNLALPVFEYYDDDLKLTENNTSIDSNSLVYMQVEYDLSNQVDFTAVPGETYEVMMSREAFMVYDNEFFPEKDVTTTFYTWPDNIVLDIDENLEYLPENNIIPEVKLSFGKSTYNIMDVLQCSLDNQPSESIDNYFNVVKDSDSYQLTMKDNLQFSAGKHTISFVGVNALTQPTNLSFNFTAVDYYKRTLIDENTGVKVSGNSIHKSSDLVISSEDTLDDNCETCKEILELQKENKVVALYNISLSEGYQEKVEVFIPLEEEGEYTVLHCNDNVLEKQDVSYKDGGVTTTWDSLSPFAVVKKEDIKDNENVNNPNESKEENENKEEGESKEEIKGNASKNEKREIKKAKNGVKAGDNTNSKSFSFLLIVSIISVVIIKKYRNIYNK